MFRRAFLTLTAISIVLLVINFYINFESFSHTFVVRKLRQIDLQSIVKLVENPLELINSDFYTKVTNYELKDWHDYEFMNYEASRIGLGENGSEVILTKPEEIKINNELLQVEGLSAYISDIISVNRSVPDVRNELCFNKLYLKHLPPVTIIVIFHNEHPSLIKRTLHSIFNRTPQELLDELILVNDASTKMELYNPLKNYIESNFPRKIKMVNLKSRVGLINARLEGAKRAKSEILVFLDSHVEVNTNWLPPLIEPVALNPRTSTVPIHDRLSWKNFAYEVHDKYGHRGLFAWDFDFRVVKRTGYLTSTPKAQPIMLGCAFAINRMYFWHLGGYDDQLLIWNGENYELSLKLWLCGGELLEVPCSRISHIFRVHNEYRRLENVDFVARNFKRIAEVWLGDYWKQFLYKTNISRFSKVDAGDLSKQFALRDRLNCKKFDYFLHYVAPEMKLVFSTPRDDDIAFGTLSVTDGNITLCLSDNKVKRTSCRMELCDKTAITPHRSQYFHYNLNKGIEHDRTDMCLERKGYTFDIESYEYKRNFWNYNIKSYQIELENSNFCVSFNFTRKRLQLLECNGKDLGQIWKFGFVNVTNVN